MLALPKSLPSAQSRIKERRYSTSITENTENHYQTRELNELLDDLESWTLSQTQENPKARRPRSEGVKLIRAILDRQPTGWKNISYFLPILLELDERPYSIVEHKMMEPMFSLAVPEETLLKSGRQVSKSTSFAASLAVRSKFIPHFDSLYVAPLQEHARKFSKNYLSPFINTLPGEKKGQSGQQRTILQKNLSNGSIIYCHYAHTSVERIRGVSVDSVILDEIQMMDFNLLPVIFEAMSHSKTWFTKYYCGTPLSLDNTIELLWKQSSQAEWAIPCKHCGHTNFPTLACGVMDMIQDDGLCCVKCNKLIDPGDDSCHWVHTVPERFHQFQGYHIPQVILTHHYSDPAKWSALIKKKRNYPVFSFVNEVLGESYDIGTRPITITDIKNASDLWPNVIRESRGRTGYYIQRVVSTDWGGGGQSDISTTAISVLGIKPTGQIDTLYMERLERGMAQESEVARVLELHKIYKCRKIVHDMAGARGHDVLMIHAGVDKRDLVNMWYVGGMHDTISLHRDAPHRSDVYYSLNKTTSIRLVCAAIRQGLIHFPEFGTSSEYTADFLTFTEERVAGINDSFLIVPSKTAPDDFLHSVVYGAMALWLMVDKFPDFAEGYGLSYESVAANYL